MTARWMLGAAVLALAVAGCGQKADTDKAEEPATKTQEPAAQTPAPADADAAADHEKAAAAALEKAKQFLAENAKKDGVKVTDSGLQYMVLSKGPDGGASPTDKDMVKVEYEGRLSDGTVFDSSKQHGAPILLPMTTDLIPGWIEGLKLMHEGDKLRLFLPPDLAYGAEGAGQTIGPNEALVFDVSLVSVVNPEKNAEKSKQFLAETAKKDGVKTTGSGLEYEVLTKGADGAVSPKASDTVKVNYEGRLIDGTVFDSSYARGEPVSFPLNRVIPGWIEGLQLMHVGDKYRLYVPSDLAYGETGAPGGLIGPNEALIFDVELLDVKAADAKPAADDEAASDPE